MIDPLLVRAKEGALSSTELSAVLTELSHIAKNSLIGGALDYPKLYPVERLKVQLTEQDLAAAKREWVGAPVPAKPKQTVGGPTNPYTQGIRDPYVMLDIVREARGKVLMKGIPDRLSATTRVRE